MVNTPHIKPGDLFFFNLAEEHLTRQDTEEEYSISKLEFILWLIGLPAVIFLIQHLFYLLF